MGRPDLFALYSDDPTFLQRFDKLCESITRKGEPDDRKIAEILAFDKSRFPKGIHWRTVRRARAKRVQTKFKEQSLAPVNEFFDQKEAQNWWNWIRSQVKPTTAAQVKAYVIDIWENVWNKRRLITINEDQDAINAVAYIKSKPEGSRFSIMVALRYLVRFGLGKPEWRDKFFRTKDLQAQPRIVSELMSPDFYKVLLPQILEKAKAITHVIRSGGRRFITDRMHDEFELTNWVKILTGIRTGDRKEERELWGLRINQGKSQVAIDQEGHVKSITVFAKKREQWHFEIMPDKARSLLEAHIKKYDLKSGDYLIQDLSDELANAILKKACRELGITPLNLHDLRKAYLTGLRLCGIPLEAAIDLMVGWKKIDTAKNHYLMLKLAPVDPYVRSLFEPIPTEVRKSFLTYAS